MPDSSPGFVRADSLTRRFGDILAVDRLSFSVDRGELFGLVGPDGAGKTTTLRMLAGVLRPTSGEAWLDRLSIARDPEKGKQRIAYMPQRFGLYGDLTVLENLHFYADLYRVPRRERPERLERLFRFSQLAPFQDRLAGRLSGGMKQKLALSCALIHQPEVLLLDEPTFGVDPVSRRDLWLIVHEMVASGVTVIASTAYLDEAERFDRIALLHHGVALDVAAPADLIASIKEEILEVRVDRVREAKAAVERLAGVRRTTIFGERLHVTMAGRSGGGAAGAAAGAAAAAAAAIEGALEQAGFAVQSVGRVEPSLEDLFIERVSGEESRE
ncbi:MAG: ABC transporter ATP-binding protein [Candidatus Eisenbacteria bacterium]